MKVNFLTNRRDCRWQYLVVLCLAMLTGMATLVTDISAQNRKKPLAKPEPVWSNIAEERVQQQLEYWFKNHPTGRVYVQVDKPLYKPGETIWFKTSLYDTATLAPFKDVVTYTCELVDPRGSTVLRKNIRMKDGSGENDFVIPQTVAGGEYKIKVHSQGGPKDERPLVIRAYQPPKIKKKLRVLGKAYGPGDRVEAKAEFRRGTGEILASHPIVAIVKVDGKEYKRINLKTDKDGKLFVSFDLPGKITEDNSQLTLKVAEGGLTESISRGIPILLNKLNVDFYPEGGDLVTGLPSRVYFQALKPNGKPAEVEGIVLDQDGEEVAKLKSYHYGMGRFEFTPEKGKTYTMKVVRPKGVTRKYIIPAAKEDGVVVRMADDFTGQRSDCKMTIHSTKERSEVIVVAAIRERIAAIRSVELERGANKVALYPSAAQGVMRITVLDEKLLPLCERVVYRNLGRDLRVQIKVDKDHYMPREKVKVTIRTTLPNGKPVPADLCLSVVDDRVLTFADDKTSHILSHLYLEKDLPGKIEEPNIYFDAKEEKSEFAMELLMGTRGWRRFDWKRVTKPALDVRVDDQIIVSLMRRQELYMARYKKGKGFAKAEGMVENKVRAMGIRKNALPQKPAVAPRVPGEAPKPPPANKKDAKEEPRKALEMAAVEDDLDIAEIVERDAPMKRRMGRRAYGWAYVRQFPKVTYATTKTDVRTDFRDTIFWAPRVRTDARGRAEVEFHLSDAITSFKIVAEGAGMAGTPGRGEKVFDSKTPMHVDAKLPVVLSAGDILELPIQFRNETKGQLNVSGGLSLPNGLKPLFEGNPLDKILLTGDQAKTFFVAMEAKNGRYNGQISYWANASGLSDKVSRPLSIEPVGFPYRQSASDVLSKTASMSFNLPKGIVKGSMSAELKFYPSPMATMLEGLESILREPGGCFEQTSSSTYPNIMVLNYLRQADVDAPKIEKRAEELIKKGYGRLVGFECKKYGYEWFGSGPGHEALTAYGLMEFIDMAKVTKCVDMKMVKRTAAWMLAQRDGQGGFKRNSKALDTFGRATPEVTNAYVVWALSEADISGLDKELDAVAKTAYKAKNGYVTALAILGLANINPKAPDVKELLGVLETQKQTDGSYKGTGRSVTGSGGRQLQIETTSLAIMARLRTGTPAAALNPSVNWLIKQRSGGGFGCTQSTIMALKALTEFAAASRATKDAGDIVVRVNGNVAARKHFNKGEEGVITVDGLDKLMQSGENNIDLQLESGITLPFSVDVVYKTTTPESNKNCSVRLNTQLQNKKVDMGETVAMVANLENLKAEGQAMTLVRLGIPAGLRPQAWQLKELREKGVIDFYETTPREVILYYRGLGPKAKKKVSLDLRADLPGTFTGIASSAYLYYNPRAKSWTQPMQVQVTR